MGKDVSDNFSFKALLLTMGPWDFVQVLILVSNIMRLQLIFQKEGKYP